MPLNDAEILELVRSEERNAIGLGDESSELSKQRTQALDYYNGDMDDLPPEEGMSRVVSRDVFEVVEGALPEIIDIFTSTDNAMEFTPVGEEDVEAARQETDVVNHVFYEENNGFMLLYTFIKDGLLSKTGYTKTFYEDLQTDEEERYFGIDDDTLATLEADDDVEIKEKETTTETKTIEVANPATQKIDEVEVKKSKHDVVLVRKTDRSGVKVISLAPEEVSVSRQTVNIQDANFVRHEPPNITRGDLIEMGISKEVVMSLPKSSQNVTTDSEKQARDTIEEDETNQNNVNKVNQFVDVADNYIRMDMDGNGKPELWHIMTAGGQDSKLLNKERIERIPIASWTPIPLTHKFFGFSLADTITDIQRIKTFFTRSAVDNSAFQNNQRPIISIDQETDTTIDDVLRNRPGQPVRVRGNAQTAIATMPNNNISAEMLNLVNYFDQVKQNRTGVTDIGQGLDPDSLNQASATATGFTGLMDKSMLRLKLIAKIFAETGLKDTFCNIHWALQKFQDKEKAIQLRGEWVNVNPSEWKQRTNMRINVGLGSGSKSQQVAMLNTTLQNQIFAMQQGTDQTDMGKINFTLRRMAELGGLGDGDQFYNRVDSDAPPPPPPPPDAAAIKAQADAQKDAADIQNDQKELELKANAQQFDQGFQIEELRINSELKAQELGLKGTQIQIEASLKDKQLDVESFLKNKELDQEAEIAGTQVGINVAKEIGANIRIGGDRL